jgi:hypothetical protein
MTYEYKAKVAVCSGIRTKQSTQSEHHVELLNIKPVNIVWWREIGQLSLPNLWSLLPLKTAITISSRERNFGVDIVGVVDHSVFVTQEMLVYKCIYWYRLGKIGSWMLWFKHRDKSIRGRSCVKLEAQVKRTVNRLMFVIQIIRCYCLFCYYTFLKNKDNSYLF